MLESFARKLNLSGEDALMSLASDHVRLLGSSPKVSVLGVTHSQLAVVSLFLAAQNFPKICDVDVDLAAKIAGYKVSCILSLFKTGFRI